MCCETTDLRPWLAALEVTTADSIFVGVPDSPWIRFQSPRSSDELRGLLRWKGRNNSYSGLEILWELEGSTGGGRERYGWTQWLSSPARDEVRGDRAAVAFEEPVGDTPLHLRTRKHFSPLPSDTPDALASDGGPRGADISRIPAPPQER